MSNTEVEVVDWEALERAGHDFVMVAPYFHGKSTYVCESCGTFMITAGLGGAVIEVWFPEREGDRACAPRLPQSRGRTLKEQMDALRERDLEKLRAL